jgi:hypothetical protein
MPVKNNKMFGTVSRVPFHKMNVATLSGVTGISTFVVNPQTSAMGALAAVGDQFDLFRVVALKYRLHPMDPTDTTIQTATYIPDVDTQTATSVQLSDATISVSQTPFCGVPSRWVKVPKTQLKGMLDWYKCTPDAGAAEFESQGVMYIAGGLSDTYILELSGMMEFKNPVSTVVMMERVLRRAEREGLVKILVPNISAALSSGSLSGSAQQVPVSATPGGTPVNIPLEPPNTKAQLEGALSLSRQRIVAPSRYAR